MTDIPAYQIPDSDLGRFGRIAVGCMGGFLAAVGGVILADQASVAGEVSDPTSWLVGAGVRVLAFTALGGLWVWLNSKETDRMKVFQAGLIAPAMISAMLYSSNSEPEAVDDAATEPPPVAGTTIAEAGVPFFATPIAGLSLAFGGSNEWAADKTTKCLINGFLGKKC